jgi:hypothetical protein
MLRKMIRNVRHCRTRDSEVVSMSEHAFTLHVALTLEGHHCYYGNRSLRTPQLQEGSIPPLGENTMVKNTAPFR